MVIGGYCVVIDCDYVQFVVGFLHGLSSDCLCTICSFSTLILLVGSFDL